MPPTNFTENNNHKQDDEPDDTNFSYDLLALIIPIGLLILFSLYIRIDCCIQDCKKSRIVDDSTSIDSRSIARSSIDSYPEFVIQPKPSIFFIKDMKQCRVDNPLDVEDICPICLEVYEERDLMVTMPCGHQYHKECIHPWLRNNIDANITPLCAMCKSELVVEYRDEVLSNENGVIIEK